jgi:hypothetical protein
LNSKVLRRRPLNVIVRVPGKVNADEQMGTPEAVYPEANESEPHLDSAWRWWGRRVVRYNMALLVVGPTAFFLYVAVVGSNPSHFRCAEITFFTIAFQAIAYLAMMGLANICYWMGALLETVIPKPNLSVYRTVAYRAGFWFSVCLPMLVPAFTVKDLALFPPHTSCQEEL